MFKMQRVHIFQADVEDKPGGTAAKLKALAAAGAHLEYVTSERSGKPGVGHLLVAPRQVKGEMELVKQTGFHEVQEPIVMRFEGDDTSGLGSRVTLAWESAGINLHGLTMAVVAGKFVGYATFDQADDANKAAVLLSEMGSQG